MNLRALGALAKTVSIIEDDLLTAYYLIDKHDFVDVNMQNATTTIRIRSLPDALHTKCTSIDGTTSASWGLHIIIADKSPHTIKFISYMQTDTILYDIKVEWCSIGQEEQLLKTYRNLCPIHAEFKNTLCKWYDDHGFAESERVYPNMCMTIHGEECNAKLVKNSSEETVEESTKEIAESIDKANSGLKGEIVKHLGDYISYIENPPEDINLENIACQYEINEFDVRAVIRCSDKPDHKISIDFHLDEVDITLVQEEKRPLLASSVSERPIVSSILKIGEFEKFENMYHFMLRYVTDTPTIITDISF